MQGSVISRALQEMFATVASDCKNESLPWASIEKRLEQLPPERKEVQLQQLAQEKTEQNRKFAPPTTIDNEAQQLKKDSDANKPSLLNTDCSKEKK